jgi:hypothetical protein
MNSRNSAMNPYSNHLSEDDLDEVLIGIASPEASAHLAECQSCGERLTAFQTQMDLFKQASMAWSEARSNTIPRELAARPATPRLTLTTVWGSAATLVFALAFALNVTLHQAPAAIEASNPPVSEPAIAVHPEHDAHEIASDNAMLEAIDSEMGTPQPAQFGLYQPVKTSTMTAPYNSDPQVRD